MNWGIQKCSKCNFKYKFIGRHLWFVYSYKKRKGQHSKYKFIFYDFFYVWMFCIQNLELFYIFV